MVDVALFVVVVAAAAVVVVVLVIVVLHFLKTLLRLNFNNLTLHGFCSADQKTASFLLSKIFSKTVSNICKKDVQFPQKPTKKSCFFVRDEVTRVVVIVVVVDAASLLSRQKRQNRKRHN